MSETYLATTTGMVRCYDLKEECVAGRGMPQCSIDAGTEVLLCTWDNDRRVAQGWLRRSDGPQMLLWMSLDSLNIIGKEPRDTVPHVEPPRTMTDAAPKRKFARPAPPVLRLEAKHSNGQASVAWFLTAAAALSDATDFKGTIPNGEQVELIDDNADGQHVYAKVRWRDQDVVVRTVHLKHLPVQLLNHDGHRQVAFFENVAAAQRNSPAGHLPNGTRATVDSANLDGTYTLSLVNLPMGARVLRSVDVQGLPQRNHNQPGHHQCRMQLPTPAQAPAPPSPAQLQPTQQHDLQLHSRVGVWHVDGKPSVCYYFSKAAAQQMGTPNGTIPSDSTAVLLELDAPSRGAAGHCKIKWSHNGFPLEVYVRRAHLFSAHVMQLSRQCVPRPTHAQQVRIRHTDRNKHDVVYHYTLEAAQRREPAHGKIPNDSTALMTQQASQGNGWAQIWFNSQYLFIREAWTSVIPNCPSL